MDQQRPLSQKLPSGLAGVLNSPEDNRDSAYFSSTDASSKHNSTASGAMGVLSPTGSHHASPVDKTPSPTSTNNGHLPLPLVSPVSNMSVASMVSPTTPGSADPRGFERPQSLDSAPNSATFSGNGDFPDSFSRRESVDSRMNQGFNDMRLGNSPYATNNHSSASIHNTLQQQRNPRPGMDSLASHRISNGYQPNAERNPEGHPKTSRIAPTITGPTTSQIARAAEPTKGQAWAFPEEDIRQIPSIASQSLIDSRRSSIADSLASSQYTTESRLPPGQRRLDEGLGGPDYRRMSASGEFSTIHHHSLQHRQIGDLQNDDASMHGSGQPYSRTPELRVSHKLAERKRRTEMKELFEQLRDLMPQERGSKASKWEILTKAISEHHNQLTQKQQLQAQAAARERENDMLKHEVHALRMELESLRRAQPHQMADPYAAADHYRPPQPEHLPPLRTAMPSVPPTGPESMTGIQYDSARVNGFRNPEQRRF
ncbi:hypothetical protein B0T19DRAFT_13789 [Cercophora scortea]|uniref:BHLH domain-containing protein n=1 Tax=Cercophora scortea TaxID=314031 RepID=A0AAE0MLP0_9PEZI|nr:hypothetical protein B0T19DRAFT_13789 [Cercophora scortea]